MKTILVVDDKSSVRMLLKEYLAENGFRVVEAVNGLEAIYSARRESPDLILLDLMMPEMDGYTFLRQYRQESHTPVIIITAKEEESDAVLGLELGADDYIIKPFRMRELVSRVHAVLRRSTITQNSGKILRSGELTLNEEKHLVTLKGKEVNLTPMEFNLLALLMSSPERVFSREYIIEHLSQNDFSGLDRTLNVHIRNLRMKIKPEPEDPDYIETIFGVGYRFRSVA